MLVNQIAVFIENRQGRLFDIVNSIANANINIVSLNIADTNDFGIVRMVTSDNQKAVQMLSSAGFTSSSVDLVGVEVSDSAGALLSVLKVLDENNISIEYIYSFSYKEGKTMILFKTTQIDCAQKVLEKHII